MVDISRMDGDILETLYVDACMVGGGIESSDIIISDVLDGAKNNSLAGGMVGGDIRILGYAV